MNRRDGGTKGWALLARRGGRLVPVVLPDRGLLGSDVDCEARLPGRGVAARHARLRVTDEGLRIEGIGAASVALGTGDRGRVLARDGDIVWLADTPCLVTRYERRNRRPWLAIGGLGSSSPTAWSAWFELALAAPHPWPVLLLGESGTGKEVAARLCHSRSSRKDGPFVAINCAALPANLVEAELFGSVKGAFTGATEGRPGAFARADGGTLLLDEIGELPLAVQAALLRVLESGEVQVVGGGTRKVDARIIAATHVDLEAACLAGRFRLDLLHRVAVTGATLPPLRLRDGDSSLLLEEMLDCPLPPGMAKVVNAHSWPGNARQLRNLARRVRLLCPRGVVSRQQLTASMNKQPTGAPRPVGVAPPWEACPSLRSSASQRSRRGRDWRI